MSNDQLLLFPLFLIGFILSNILSVKSEVTEVTNNPCPNQLPQALFELKNSWIYICSEPEQLWLFQVLKNNPEPLLKVPASGGFPTYAAVEGDLSDPNSKIVNISPFDFKIIQASIITKIEPVLRTIDGNSGAVITILSGQKEKAAVVACGEDEPVQAFETENSQIYICIEANENDPNAINLTYVQLSPSNGNAPTRLKAELISGLRYQTSPQNQVSYIIGYQGLETWENGRKINTEPLTHVYLKSPDSSREISE